MDFDFFYKNCEELVAPWPEAPQMPLEPPDQKHWKAASGYVQLGMYLEADAQLDQFCRAAPEVLAVRLERRHLFFPIKQRKTKRSYRSLIFLRCISTACMIFDRKTRKQTQSR
jgi:hypothetical protein